MAKTAIITGASAGIGKALAMELAKRGYDLGLLARRMDALEAVAAEIHAAHGHRVEVGALDVSRDQDVGPALERLATKLGGVDVVIANAGITAVNRTGAGDFEVDKRVIRTNLLGAMATIDAAVRIFRAQGRGHVVGVSSVSAFRGIPGSGAYSASKAALTNYLDAARIELRNKNVAVTVIHPGFVATEISSNMEKMPFVISAEAAAKDMADAIEAKKADVVVPAWPWRLHAPAMKLLPDRLIAKVF